MMEIEDGITFSHENVKLLGHPLLSAARRDISNGRLHVAHAIATILEVKNRMLFAKCNRNFAYSLSAHHIHDYSIEGMIYGNVPKMLEFVREAGITTEGFYPSKNDERFISPVPCPLFRIKDWWQISGDALEVELCNHINHDGPLLCLLRKYKCYATLAGDDCYYKGNEEFPNVDEVKQYESFHAGALVGYGTKDKNLAFRFLDSAGPRVGVAGVRWISPAVIYKVWNIRVGGIETITNFNMLQQLISGQR